MNDLKLTNNYLSGDIIKVNNVSKNWHPVRITKDSFYNRQTEYEEALLLVKGVYTDLLEGHEGVVRFTDEEDAVTFRLTYDRCL